MFLLGLCSEVSLQPRISRVSIPLVQILAPETLEDVEVTNMNRGKKQDVLFKATLLAVLLGWFSRGHNLNRTEG